MRIFTEDEQKEIFSHNLRYFVERKCKDQRTICLEIEVNPPTFNQWINGKAIPSISMIRRLCTYFHCGLSELVNPPADSSKKIVITNEEMQMIKTYRELSEDKKSAICDILHIKRGTEEVEIE